MASLTEIHELEGRYPFSEDEIEILLRCHKALKDGTGQDSFVMKLAMCSPYATFFMPGNELRRRVEFLENYVLPSGFSSELRAATSTDAFVNYANLGMERSLERFLEGIANTGRRGPHEALRVMYNIVCDDGDDNENAASDLIELAFALSVASNVLVSPTATVDQEPNILRRIQNFDSSFMVKSLLQVSDNRDGTTTPLTQKMFVEWAEDNMPLLASTLLTFVHRLIFHTSPLPPSRIPYIKPEHYHVSDIFNHSDAHLFAFGCMTPKLAGQWHRLYSSEQDGRSFNRLEHSILGYGGPTLMVIRTAGENEATLGAFMSSPWKESSKFHGDSDSFLFQLEPTLGVYRPVGGKDENIMYLNPSTRHTGSNGLPHGIGFGGSLNKPRLFIPESLDALGCASSLDFTYQMGNLLPEESLETFEIKVLEIWGVGDDALVTQALRDRANFRERTESAIYKARHVSDKVQFVQDLQSGLIPNNLYKHQEDTRGRGDFSVDEAHDGYKVDRE